ncbi:hypothetical protein BDZ91DRAFT_737095, partial [Kalaharituber pfeilii]
MAPAVSFSCYVLYGSDFRCYSPHDFTSAFNAARSASRRPIVLLFRILLASESGVLPKLSFACTSMSARSRSLRITCSGP